MTPGRRALLGSALFTLCTAALADCRGKECELPASWNEFTAVTLTFSEGDGLHRSAVARLGRGGELQRRRRRFRPHADGAGADPDGENGDRHAQLQGPALDAHRAGLPRGHAPRRLDCVWREDAGGEDGGGSAQGHRRETRGLNAKKALLLFAAYAGAQLGTGVLIGIAVGITYGVRHVRGGAEALRIAVLVGGGFGLVIAGLTVFWLVRRML